MRRWIGPAAVAAWIAWAAREEHQQIAARSKSQSPQLAGWRASKAWTFADSSTDRYAEVTKVAYTPGSKQLYDVAFGHWRKGRFIPTGTVRALAHRAQKLAVGWVYSSIDPRKQQRGRKAAKDDKAAFIAQVWERQGAGSRPAPELPPPIKGMEGPFLYPDGRVRYWDPREGSYYDRGTDLYDEPKPRGRRGRYGQPLPGMREPVGTRDYDVGLPSRKYAVRMRGTSKRDIIKQAREKYGVKPDMIELAAWE